MTQWRICGTAAWSFSPFTNWFGVVFNFQVVPCDSFPLWLFADLDLNALCLWNPHGSGSCKLDKPSPHPVDCWGCRRWRPCCWFPVASRSCAYKGGGCTSGLKLAEQSFGLVLTSVSRSLRVWSMHSLRLLDWGAVGGSSAEPWVRNSTRARTAADLPTWISHWRLSQTEPSRSSSNFPERKHPMTSPMASSSSSRCLTYVIRSLIKSERSTIN